MQIIFQDPYGSLNPRMTVLDLVAESLDTHFTLSREERRRQVVALLERVGLSSELLFRYPHEFSGGQRQRIGIARAMILKPNLVVADEPVSALDASVQSQVLSLLSDFQKEYRLAYLLISHDLSLVRRFAHRTAVMYLGRIVEVAESRALADRPIHPYTQRLLWAVPKPDPRHRLSAFSPSPFTPFCNHSPFEAFNLFEAQPKHFVACHLRPEDNRSMQAAR
jgi:ABC-type oligopeptide transport system ATPase subunit